MTPPKDAASAPGALETALRRGQFAITAEITPPVTCRREDILAKAMPLKGLADAVNVTDGAGAKVHLAAVTAAAMLQENGIEPVLQLVCRDRNRIALQSELLAASAWGIRNLLLLRGDDPGAGDQPEAKGVFDLDARGLIGTAAAMRDDGTLPTGTVISGRPGFFIGCADTPVDPSPDWQPQALKAKIGAGAQFAQTQFCMDAGVIRRYAARLVQSGIGHDFSLLIGIVPLRSAGSAQWMRHHLRGTIIPDAAIERMQKAPDPAAEGQHLCLELIEEISAIPGVAGVHVMAPGNEAGLIRLLEQARRLKLPRMPVASATV